MIAFIPARGGSKGVPGKNIKEICGKPLIAWTIEAALKADCIDRVIVTTDDEAIARVAKEYGAEVPFMRPAELSSDTASAIDVYLHATEFVMNETGEKIDKFMVLLPTVPLRTEKHIDEAFNQFKADGATTLISFAERAQYHEMLKELDLGLEDRLTAKVGLLSGGQRQALTLLMATLQKPQLLLLDEHTAALDPKTAAKVLEITDMLIKEHGLTAMMVTHNMRDAIRYGNRLIMMNEGKVILNISGEEKQKLTIEDLLHKFEEVSGTEFTNDTEILSK